MKIDSWLEQQAYSIRDRVEVDGEPYVKGRLYDDILRAITSGYLLGSSKTENLLDQVKVYVIHTTNGEGCEAIGHSNVEELKARLRAGSYIADGFRLGEAE